jgi:hypothetical protein
VRYASELSWSRFCQPVSFSARSTRWYPPSCDAGVGPVGSVARGDVRLDPEDGLDAVRPCLLVEGDRAVQVAVVGDRDGVHPEFFDPLDELVDAVAAVEQRVLGVQVEVDEAGVSVNRQPSWVLRTALIAGMSVLTLVVLLIIIPALIVGALVFFALLTLHRIRLALFGAGAPRERNQRRNVIVIGRDSDRT